MAISEVEILTRVIDPDQPTLPTEVARSFLTLDFPVQDRVRMDQLAEKARQGELVPDEREEMENYIRVGHFISLMRSKARLSLRDETSAS